MNSTKEFIFNIYNMEKEKLKELISEGLSTRNISKKTGKGQSTIRYWLKKYDLKTIYVKGNNTINSKEKKCCGCNEIKEKSEFYKRRKNTLQSYCKTCLLTYQKEWWIEKKKDAIIYKGSKCEDCDLSYPEETYIIFDFHHLNPLDKKYDWNKMRMVSKDKMYKELDKCVLLCSNCHRKRHHYDKSLRHW